VRRLCTMTESGRLFSCPSPPGTMKTTRDSTARVAFIASTSRLTPNTSTRWKSFSSVAASRVIVTRRARNAAMMSLVGM
jgi:hypothetical protein